MSVLQYRRYQKRDADLDAVAASGVATAWTAYTPTITAFSGTFTTVSATGRYLTIGKTTCVQISITITTNGTAASSVIATLPNTVGGASSAFFTGRENSATGVMLQGLVTVSGTTVTIRDYFNAYPGGSGRNLYVGGCYENT